MPMASCECGGIKFKIIFIGIGLAPKSALLEKIYAAYCVKFINGF
jgi:hypothetical protein